MSEQNNSKIHNVIMEKRQKLNMSGIKQVVGFEDDVVVLDTEMGVLTVRGSELKIGAFSTESSDINIEGNIVALIYSEKESERGGFFRRMMK